MNSNLNNREGVRRLRWLSPSLLALAVLTFVGLAAPSAKADTYDFSLTNGTNTVDFSMASGFTPDASMSGVYFEIASMSYTLNGVSESAVPAYFWSTAMGGGLDLGSYPSILLNQGGVQLYTGSESDPTGFTLGTFNLTDWGGASMTGPYTLTITDPPGPSMPTPEPSSLLLLGAGLLAVGGLIAHQQIKRGVANESSIA